MSENGSTRSRVVELFSTQGYKLSEIATEVGVSRQRVHQIVHQEFNEVFVSETLRAQSAVNRRKKVIEQKTGMPYTQYVKQKTEYLTGLRWHTLYTECTVCGTTRKSHRARGMCSTCYYTWAYHNLPTYRESLKRSQQRWEQKNKNKRREYNQKQNAKRKKAKEEQAHYYS